MKDSEIEAIYKSDSWKLYNSRVGSEWLGGHCPPIFTEGAWSPLQTSEGHNITIIISLCTKAVIQFHKDPLYEYHL